MSNCKRGLEDKSQWLVQQDLIDYCEGKTIWPIHVLKERKCRGILFPRRVYTMSSVVVFYSQVRVYTKNLRKLFCFYVVRQSKVCSRVSNQTDYHFCEVFIPKWGFTPWTDWRISRFRIEESCSKFEETKWIVMQDVDLGVCGSLRYSSWIEIYFWLKSVEPQTCMTWSLFDITW